MNTYDIKTAVASIVIGLAVVLFVREWTNANAHFKSVPASQETTPERIELADIDSAPVCAAGDYFMYVDSNKLTFKICSNGTIMPSGISMSTNGNSVWSYAPGPYGDKVKYELPPEWKAFVEAQ